MNKRDKQVKEDNAKKERAYDALMRYEKEASLYIAYMLVVDKSKEYAEKILNTPLA